MQLKRILLTGANGFVGRHIIDHIPTNVEIFCIKNNLPSLKTKSACNWLKADLLNYTAIKELIEKIKPDCLIHTAWNTKHGFFWSSEDNRKWLKASENLLRVFALNEGKRAIMCGTGAEYSITADAPFNENTADTIPNTFYGQCKLALYNSAIDIAQNYDISFAWARIFNIYGPYEKQQRLVPNIILSLLQNKPALCSSGKQVRDFMDVRDLGNALSILTFSNINGPINMGYGKPVTIKKVASLLGKIIGYPELISLGTLPDRENEPEHLYPDVTLLNNKLGFQPKITLEDGLYNAVKWWKENLNNYI